MPPLLRLFLPTHNSCPGIDIRCVSSEHCRSHAWTGSGINLLSHASFAIVFGLKARTVGAIVLRICFKGNFCIILRQREHESTRFSFFHSRLASQTGPVPTSLRYHTAFQQTKPLPLSHTLNPRLPNQTTQLPSTHHEIAKLVLPRPFASTKPVADKSALKQRPPDSPKRRISTALGQAVHTSMESAPAVFRGLCGQPGRAMHEVSVGHLGAVARTKAASSPRVQVAAAAADFVLEQVLVVLIQCYRDRVRLRLKSVSGLCLCM